MYYELFLNFAAIMDISQYTIEAVALLERLISTPSVSRDEACAADIFESELGDSLV